MDRWKRSDYNSLQLQKRISYSHQKVWNWGTSITVEWLVTVFRDYLYEKAWAHMWSKKLWHRIFGNRLQGMGITDCSSPLEEFTECSTEEVCTWSSWSSWSACGAVSGSALRQRPMVNMCSKSAHPLGKHRCTGHDEEQADCVELCGIPQWSEWEEGKNHSSKLNTKS